MKTKRGIVAVGWVGVGFLVLSLVSAPAYGQWRGRGHGMRGTFGLLSPRLAKAIELTEEQHKQIQAIRDAHKESLQTLRSQMREVRAEIANKLYGPGVVKEEDLASQIKQLAELREKRRQEGLKVALEVRGVLTEEQLAKARDLRQRMGELRSEMRSLYEGTQ